MSKLTTILMLLVLSCSTVDKYELFDINTVDNFEFLDFDKINDIKTFNDKFWYADSVNDNFTFIAKFDFEKGDFSNTSDKGLKLEGLPFVCLEYDCNRRYGQDLYISDNYEVLNLYQELMSEQQIKDLVKTNILNYGRDPRLSDEPKEAVTELYLKPDHKISKLGPILKIISDAYIEIILSKRLETKWTDEKIMDEFPFRIHLRQNMIPLETTKTIDMPTEEEIEGELLLDSVALNLK